MTDYVWCHGPECHKRSTTSRVRGSKGSKVLRTMKVKQDRVSIWKYFCDQSCLMDFITEHVEEFARLHPRREALETPIEVTKETHTYNHGYGDRHYTTTEIKPIDNNEQIG